MACALETVCVWVWMGQRKQVIGGIGSWDCFAVALAGFKWPELTEQWSERVSFWVRLSVCRVDFLEYPVFS